MIHSVSSSTGGAVANSTTRRRKPTKVGKGVVPIKPTQLTFFEYTESLGVKLLSVAS